MNWQNIPDGYEFRVYLSHGRYDIRAVETVNCSLDESEFNKIYQILHYFPKAVEANAEGSTEDVAQYIESKIGSNQAAILTVIDKLVQSDAIYEEQIASITAIEIFRYADGHVQKYSI